MDNVTVALLHLLLQGVTSSHFMLSGHTGEGMGRRHEAAELKLPEHVRLLVPVLAAGGGQGRSTVAALLAAEFARATSTSIIFDTVPRALSPWHGWVSRQGGGLESIPPDRPLTAQQTLDAASTCTAGDTSWQVLTSHQPWGSAPLRLPDEPAAWNQLANIGGWATVTVDTGYSVLEDLDYARFTGAPSRTAGWMTARSVVLCVDQSAQSVERAQAVIDLAESDSLPVNRIILVVTARSARGEPRAASAGLTMLAPRVHAIVRMPYDQAINAFGIKKYDRVGNRTRATGRQICEHAITLALGGRSTSATPKSAADLSLPFKGATP